MLVAICCYLVLDVIQLHGSFAFIEIIHSHNTVYLVSHDL